MVEAVDSGSVTPAARQDLHQFIKFCIIGFTSTIIDVGLLNLLSMRFGLHWVIAQIISFSFAVTNGFIWNSIWTFRGMGSGKKHEQYLKFVVVNIVGLLLNIAIMKTVMIAITGQLIHHGPEKQIHINIGKAVAIVIVSVWNYVANKKWTFK